MLLSCSVGAEKVVAAVGRSLPVAGEMLVVWSVSLLLLPSRLTMVGAGGPARGSRAAVMAAPKIMAPKISADIIPIITSSCFFDGPHPTSLLSPWVWFELSRNDNFMLR